MSQTFASSFLTITATGLTVTTGASSASATIPVDAAGNNPRFIRVAATTESYVRLGTGTPTATTNDILVQPADSLLLSTNGLNKIAYIQGTSAGKVNIMPTDNV